MLAAPEVLLSDTNNVFVRMGGLLIQVRAGSIDVPTIDRIEEAVEGTVAHLEQRRTGFIAVLEPGAETAPWGVRERQRQLVARVEERSDTRLAAVVLGDSVAASVSRAIGRAMVFRSKRLRVVATIKDAAQWVAPHMGVPTETIFNAVEDARRTLAKSRSEVS